MEDRKIDLEELEINQERLLHNNTQLQKSRTYATLNAGIIAGILGMDGWIGIGVYAAVFLVVSLGLAIKFNFNGKEYFRAPSQAYFGRFGSDLLLFLMIWVIFHNLVNIL